MQLEVRNELSEDAKSYFGNMINEYNAQASASLGECIDGPIQIISKNKEGVRTGGLFGSSLKGSIEIKILVVDEAFQKQGIGTMLMNKIEEVAKERDCNLLFLDTASFQAPEFYKKLGYEEVCCFENNRNGMKFYKFKKELF